MTLTAEEKHRYSRHLLMNEIGLKGQERLKQASVLVVGAGGLGCPALQYLAAAGVGRIGIIDDDVVDETNLQRQVLFTTKDVGRKKAKVATEQLQAMNPFITVECYEERLTNSNALAIFPNYDIVLDGTDNFSTRYLINDACILTQKPLVYGAIYKFEGQVAVFNYEDGPSYRCLFPEPPAPGEAPSCNEIGVLGVLPGIIGTMQAAEVLKLITGTGTPLSGKLLLYDAANQSQNILEVARNEEEVKKVINAREGYTSFDYDYFCHLKPEIQSDEVTKQELIPMLEKGIVVMVDVRESYEKPEIPEFKALKIPLSQLEIQSDKIPNEGKVVLFCQTGARSRKALNYLKQSHTNLMNLAGGVKGWIG